MKSMKPLELGAVIAERRLQYHGADGKIRRIRVLLGAPQRSAKQQWYCPWQIVGLADKKIRAAYGVDGFQALQLVMSIIGAELRAQLGGRGPVLWQDGSSAPNFGFPLK